MLSPSKARDGAAKAISAGFLFDAEIVPVPIKTKKGIVEFATDEHPRPDSSLDALARLKPAFKPNGTVTAGNASGLNDGAATLAVATEKYAVDNAPP